MTPQQVADHIDPFMDELKRDGQMVAIVIYTPGPVTSEADDFMLASNLQQESALVMLRRFLDADYIGSVLTKDVRES